MAANLDAAGLKQPQQKGSRRPAQKGIPVTKFLLSVHVLAHLARIGGPDGLPPGYASRVHAVHPRLGGGSVRW